MGQSTSMQVLVLVAASLGIGVHTARLHRRQTNFGSADIADIADTADTADTRIFGLLGGLFGGEDCVCVTDGRRRRQAEVDTKFFFGGSTACPCPSSAEPDCKGRPEGDTYYGCGWGGGGGGGLFGFGRKKRQVRNEEENVNTRFLDFRCIGAAILGRKAT